MKSTLTNLMNKAESRRGNRNIVRFIGPDGVRFKEYPARSEQPLKQCRVGETMDVIGTWLHGGRCWTDDHKLQVLLNTHLFGFSPTIGSQYFQIDIPADPYTHVVISHILGWNGEPAEPTDAQQRIKLSRGRWEAIAEAVEQVFNRQTEMYARSRPNGPIPFGEWQPGHNLVGRSFGKELMVLAWAIEEVSDVTQIAQAIVNWMGLNPEERWWLYTQTAAATGHWLHGLNKGWRKALRYALTENPTGINYESE